MSTNKITIDESRCVGCGQCTTACHEGAIILKNGIAQFKHAQLCDGLGNCLQACPQGAISFHTLPAEDSTSTNSPNWPIQLQLVQINASFFKHAHLLIAAHCTAFACADIHTKHMQDKVTLIVCPKLDQYDYGHKLTQILQHNHIHSVTVARMQVPCCTALEQTTKAALTQSGKELPFKVVVIPI